MRPVVAWNWIRFVELGLAWGIFGGLLEGVVRVWLQSAAATNFDMRQTAISLRLLWVAPASYAILFALAGLGVAGCQRLVKRIDLGQPATIAFGALAFLGPVAASGRIANIATVILAVGLALTVDRLVGGEPVIRQALVRRTWPGLVVLTVLVGLGVEFGTRQSERATIERLPPPPPGAPNVLLIVVDTLRADRVFREGAPQTAAPTLTRLASEGVRFDWAIASSSWSLPSHVSMLTGRSPAEHSAEIHNYDGRFALVSETFRDRGYRTAAISANTLVFTRAQGFASGFVRFDDSFYSLLDGFTRTMLGRQLHKALARPVLGLSYFHPVARPAEAVTDSATSWIQASGGRPFFLVLNYFDIHDRDLPITIAGRDAYDTALAAVDQALGQLLQALEAAGLARNTIVAVTSDHGESLGQHGWPGHGNVLNVEQIHVPLIFRFPPKIPAGGRISTPVSLMSVPATLLDLAEGTDEGEFPGPSLVRLWTNPAGTSDWPPPISELRYRPWQPKLEGQDALKSSIDLPWHFIQHSAGGPELFNLQDDPGEVNNLAADPAYRDTVERFQRALAGQSR